MNKTCKKLLINKEKNSWSFLFFNLIFSNFCEDVFGRDVYDHASKSKETL
jgi:hypothetical protein